MSIQLIDFYRYSCVRGVGGPTIENWTTGDTLTLTITPAAQKYVHVTELNFFTKDGFTLADEIRINPWGYASPANVDLANLRQMYSIATNIEPMGPIFDSDSYHWIQIKFRPHIVVSAAAGTEFTVANTGGIHGVIGEDLEIVAFSYEIPQEDA